MSRRYIARFSKKPKLVNEKKQKTKKNRKKRKSKTNREKAERKEARYKRLEKFAKQQQERRNFSDIWFQHLWEESGMYLKHGWDRDQFNVPFEGLFVPDCLNTYYCYIIESDDPSHVRRVQSDFNREEYFRSRGYKVFRVHAGDYEGFKKLKVDIAEYRQQKKSDYLQLDKGKSPV